MTDQQERFRVRVEDLIDRFERGIDRDEWATRRYPKRFRDEAGRLFEIPALFLQKGPVKLLLDPIGYDVPGAEGVADLYVMPAYDPAASVYFEGGDWAIHPTPVPNPRQAHPAAEDRTLPTTAEAINRVLNAIAEHA